MLCTSMMRGFNRLVLCMRNLYMERAKKHGAGTLRPALLRIKLNYEVLVDVLRELGTIRRALELSGQFLGVDFDPRRKADLLRELQRVLNAELRLRFFGRRHDITGAQQRGWNVL